MTKAQAKKIIRDLLDAGNDTCLAGNQDGGKNIDIVFSRKKGHTDKVMTLAEAEQRMDAAILSAWKVLMPGHDPDGDLVEFINS